MLLSFPGWHHFAPGLGTFRVFTFCVRDGGPSYLGGVVLSQVTLCVRVKAPHKSPGFVVVRIVAPRCEPPTDISQHRVVGRDHVTSASNAIVQRETSTNLVAIFCQRVTDVNRLACYWRRSVPVRVAVN